LTLLATRDTQSDVDIEDYIDETIWKVNLHKVTLAQHDFNRLAPNFGFVPTKRIQKTIEHTTQFCRLDARLPLLKHFKSRFPAANIPHRNEIVATDTFFSDVPAHDDTRNGSAILWYYQFNYCRLSYEE
jgi:hypothetical protein